jgi:uncharacterized protein YegP (UPF0339 family)
MRHLARYEVFEDEAGEFRWRLRAANGEIIAQSEGYTRKEDAERGLTAAKESSAEADLEARPDDAA